MIYFDNSATTQPYPEVLDAFTTAAQKYFGNPSSLHELGIQAEKLLTQAREHSARLLRVSPEEIIFTSGGTEGNNTAIKGAAYQYQNRGKHIITTEIEHASVAEPFKQLEEQGFDVTYVPVDQTGTISVNRLMDAIRPDTILVSMIHVNNELGSVQPIAEVGALLKNHPKVLFHVDTIQGIGKVPLDFKEAHVDLATLSAHKFHGLKGTGILYVRSGVKLYSILAGGSQELTTRAGTENVAGAVSLAKALRLTIEKAEHGGIAHINRLKQKLMDGLEQIEGVFMNTAREHTAPHIVNFSAPGIRPEVLVHSLAKRDIYVSTRSACSSKAMKASRVLLASGFSEERALSGIRVSFTYTNTESEVDQFLQQLTKILPTLKTIMR